MKPQKRLCLLLYDSVSVVGLKLIKRYKSHSNRSTQVLNFLEKPLGTQKIVHGCSASKINNMQHFFQ